MEVNADCLWDGGGGPFALKQRDQIQGPVKWAEEQLEGKSSKYFSSRQKRKSFQTSLLSFLCVVLTCAAPRATAGDCGVGGGRSETAETTATDRVAFTRLFTGRAELRCSFRAARSRRKREITRNGGLREAFTNGSCAV